jgi:predicted small integral membrane protein
VEADAAWSDRIGSILWLISVLMLIAGEFRVSNRIMGWLERLAAPHVICAILVGLNAAYVLLAVFGNITDFGTNKMFVHHVLDMDTTNFGQPSGQGLDTDVTWHAVHSSFLQTATYCSIIAWQILTGLVLLYGTLQWPFHRTVQARAVSTVGLLMLVLQFFGGFIVIGGEWFEMWRSAQWKGTNVAFRCVVLALFTLMFVQFSGRLPTTSTPAHGGREETR